jgi:hypothetical protein
VQDGYNDDFDDQSFLRKRPEILAEAEREDHGASGLPGIAVGIAAASAINEALQHKPRSRSTSPPVAEKTLDLTPKSLSRPASPEINRPHGSRSPQQRRHSVAKTTTESPTAVPIHFRRPPTSPGLSRAVPVEQPAPISSPGSPSQQRTRRPNSLEFRNSREIRPLWLVERHGLIKGEPETEEPLPSLPSSKSSSRVPSIEDLKSLGDDDGMKSWEHVDLSHSIIDNRRPTGLTVSTDYPNASDGRDQDRDLLDSQQATPTAEHFADSEFRKERPRYEFHSPSELLRDPAVLDQLPSSPTLDPLPSAEGSAVGVGSREQETQRALDALEGVSQPQQAETPTQEKNSFFGDAADFAKGVGFAGVVDAAAIAAVKEHDEHRSLAADQPEAGREDIRGFGDIVDAAVAAEGSSRNNEKVSADEELSEPVTAIEAPASASFDAPQSTEQPIEPSELQPQPETELVADEGAATQSSKKKKKKKGKKDKAATEEHQTQDTALEAPVLEPASAESEAVAPQQAQAEPVEATRELGPGTDVQEPVAEAASPEAAPAESEPAEASLEPEPSVPATQETDIVIPSETENAQPASTETEQGEESKKSKRDKKKEKKKKAKNASSAEEPADDTTDPKEIAATLSTADDMEKSQSQQESRELIDPVEQLPSEEPVLPVPEESTLPADEQEAQEADFTDANENQLAEAAQPEAEEASRSLDDTEKRPENPSPELTVDNTTPAIPATPKEDTEGEDNFEEAVEEQTPQPAEDKAPAPEPPVEVVEEVPAEAAESKSEKRKNKKKKNRKSAAVEDTQVPETPAPETETQPESQEFGPEQSAAAESADTQPSPIGGEALPFDIERLEKAANDVEPPSEITAEAPAATPEQEPMPLEPAVDATPVVAELAQSEDPSTEVAEPAVIETQPNVELQGSADESSREILETSAVETQPETEAQPQPQPEGEAEAEHEASLTASQKKKAKKNKKKSKQSQSSIPDEDKPAESTTPAPETDTAAEGDPKEALVTKDAPADVPPQENPMELPVEATQPLESEQPSELERPTEVAPAQEEATPVHLPEPVADVTVEEAAKEEFAVPEEQPKAEENPTEPEVPMTAAERKKAKKMKKKQQKEQEESAKDGKPVEAELAPDAQSTEASEGTLPAADVAEAEPVSTADVSMPEITETGETEQDAVPTSTNDPEATSMTEDVSLPADNQTMDSTEDIELVAEAEPSVDAAPVVGLEATEPTAEIAHEAPATSHGPEGLDQEIELPKSEELESKDVISVPTQEASVAATETEAAKELEIAPEPEVPMTAAERKKAKKNKKKQQKQQSVDIDEQPAPSVNEEQIIEQSADVLPETQATFTPEVVAGVDESTNPDTSRDLEAIPNVEEEQAAIETSVAEPISTTEFPEKTTDVQHEAQETISETTAEVPAPTEDLPEEQKVHATVSEELALDNSVEDKPTESIPEPVMDESPVAEPTEADQDAISSKSKKKNKKKKRQSVVTEEEQPAPAGEDSNTTSVEQVAEPTPEEEAKSTPAEEELTESTPSQEIEQPPVDKDVETPLVAEEEEAPKAEELHFKETTQPDAPVDVAAAEAAEEALMTPAQKRKAKKDKKKRQSLAIQEDQPAPAEEPNGASTEVESTLVPSEEAPVPEPTPGEEIEQPSVDKEAEAPPVTEELKAEEPAPEESTQPDALVDAAAAEAAAEALMTPAEKRKAKKDKKKRQSLATQDNQPAPTEEPKPASAEEEPTPVLGEGEHTESTDPSTVEQAEQPTIDKDVEAPAVTEEPPKTEEPAPEDLTQQDAPADALADAAAAEAAEEAAMTPAQKRKAKKDKKKRQSLATEEQSVPAEESKPTSTEEESTPVLAEGESTEPPSITEEAEQPTIDKEVEAPIVTEEPPKAEEPPLEEVAQQDAPADPAATESAEEEAMTPAQKRKAKKDKKKQRKSVAFEDDATPSAEESKPEQDSPAPRIDSQDDAPADLVATEESTKELPVAEESVDPAAEKEVSEITEHTAPSEQPAGITEQEPATAAPSDALETPHVEELTSAVEPSAQPEQDTHIPSETQSQDETQAEAGMTAKERRKAKKNKKKGKSVDLTDDAPAATEPPQESEPSVPTPADVPIEVSEVQETPTSEPMNAPEAPQEEIVIEPEALKVEEAESKDAVLDDDLKEEAAETKEMDNKPPATETTVDSEQGPSTEAEAVSSPAEPTEEAGMSAKERRKAAKKAKKRQSKNVGADNDAATSIDAADSVEKVLTKDTDTPGLPAVTTISSAEHDGKEHQSHDTQNYDAPAAQDPASTDEFMSSQVEQTPIESQSPFLDYPPQPVLERSVNSGELEEVNAQQQEDVVPAAQEPENESVESAPLDEVKAVDGEIVEGKSSVPEADDLSMEKETEEKPVDVPGEVVPEVQTPESQVEEAVSKKQKKNKKKNQKQGEEIAAEPTIEAEPVAVLEEQPADQSEDVETATVQTTEGTQDTEVIGVQEAEPVPSPAEEPEAEPQPEEQPVPEAAETSVADAEIPPEAAPIDTLAEEPAVQPINSLEESTKEIDTLAEVTEEPIPSQELESEQPSPELPTTGERPVETEAEQPTEQASPETLAAPEELPIAPKKLSKKEKKKAAAAAAAGALLEEEKLAESQSETPESSDIIPHAPEEVVEQPVVEELLAPEFNDVRLPEADRIIDEFAEQATSIPKEDVHEPVTEASESVRPVNPEVQPEESTKKPADEPAAADVITRKMSKKDKKKAKKQAEQELVNPSSALSEESTEPEPLQVAHEPESTPGETLPEPVSISAEAPQPEPENIGTAVFEGSNVISEDKQPLESQRDEALVSLNTPETAAPGEPTDQESNYEPLNLEGAANNDEQDEAQTSVAKQLAGDQHEEPVPALSKKMSKKDKRKAKKNADITEELPVQQDSEPEATLTNVPTELEPPKESEHAAETQSTTERELPTEAPVPIADQPTLEPEAETEPVQIDEPAADEKPSLSRRASKKKAKKVKKAGNSLEIEPPAQATLDHDHQNTIAPFEDDQSKAHDTGAPIDKSALGEEDWPAIDWEQAKFEESQRLRETDAEPEPEIAAPDPEIIGEFDESSIPEALQDSWREPKEPSEGDAWALPASKKDKKAKKNKKALQQPALEIAESSPETFNDKEIEPPARTTTPGGTKIANLFPGLERGGFRRSALDKKTPSLKDSAEEETTADLEANRDIAIPVLEAPLATTQPKEVADISTHELPGSLERQIESTISELEARHGTPPAIEDASTREPECPAHGERSLDAPFSLQMETPKEHTLKMFNPSPSSRSEEPSSPTRLPPQAQAGEELCELRRSPSIHGRHQPTPRTWSLDEPSLQALHPPSPPRSLFGGPAGDDHVRPRTPLDTIAEQEPRDDQGATVARRGTPRLEMKPEHVLPRPQTPVRKFTDNAFDREAWPTERSKGSGGSKQDILKTPEQGMPILKPSTSSGKLRRTNRSVSGDLRAASRALDSQPSNLDLDQLPSSSSYDPVTDKGKRPLRNMSDVYVSY